MSLDYRLTRIKDYEEFCFMERDCVEDDLILKSATQNLIFKTMAVGIGEITKKNYVEFYTRCNFLDRFHHISSEQGTTLEQVQQHIGLSTNVFPKEPQSKWLKRVFENHARDIRWANREKIKELQ